MLCTTLDYFSGVHVIDSNYHITYMHTRCIRGRLWFDVYNGRTSLNLANSNSDRDKFWVPPIELLLRREHSRVRIFERSDHASQKLVEVLSALRFSCDRTKGNARCFPIQSAKSWIVITLLDRLPNIIEHC